MKTFRLISGFALCSTLLSCGQSHSSELKKAEAEDTAANGFISSSAAVENGKDSSRRFVRTADLKFKVKSVIQSTYDIENITNRQGGFVIYTKLSSSINNVYTTPVSKDSSLETTTYTVSNSITLRVPNTQLETTLKEIATNIEYLDYRVIKAEDVALQILSNNMTQSRVAKNEERIENVIDKKGRKPDETALAEELLLSKQEEADQAKIANLNLDDQIKFSTVNISIYQREALKRELIANDKNIDAYEAGLGTKIAEALKSGWSVLELLIVGLIRLWGVFLIIALGWFLYRRYRKNK